MFVDKEFLQHRRVEILAVLLEVGTQRFWEYILIYLSIIAYLSIYNRDISIPAVETLYPKPIQDFLLFINALATEATKDEETKIPENLEEVKGMINVDEENKEIFDQLIKIVEEDDVLKKLIPKITEFTKE